jgi:hypothetical protein
MGLFSIRITEAGFTVFESCYGMIQEAFFKRY